MISPAYRSLASLTLLLGGLLAVSGCQSAPEGRPASTPGRPNIVLILADDLGLGDLSSYNLQSKIPTLHLSRLAAEGIRFTDAHAPGSWCVPSRYGLLTGAYPHRDTMRAWTERALIDSGQPTLATLLKGQGYATYMAGKWHLGFEGGTDYDCSQPFRGGPIDHGFDRFFGLPASLDIPPYFYIRGDACVEAPTDTIVGNQTDSDFWTDIQGAFWRGGAIAPGFHHAAVLPRLRQEAVAFLEAHHRERAGQPFFLYLALTAPHTPWLPPDSLRGESEAGLYGDFVVQVDHAVGRVLAALERLSLEENTLVIFSSDNGPVWYPKDEERFAHRSTYLYRGMKGDAWEGGHRMPFIARWPGHVEAGATSDQLLSFTDLLATFAALTGAEVPPGAGKDSYNLLPALLGEEAERTMREGLVHYTGAYLAVRQGPWKLIPGLGSGGFSNPRTREPQPGEPEGQLYNLANDPPEQHNVYAEYPEIVRRLTDLLKHYRRQTGRPQSKE